MNKLKISVFTDEVYEDLYRQIEVLKRNNIKYMEVRGIDGKCIVDYDIEKIYEIKKKLDEAEIKVSAIGSPIGKISITEDFEPHLKLFKHTLKIAEILETKYVRIFSFFIPEGEDPYIYREEVMNRWYKFVEVAKKHDIILLHENEKDIYGDTYERCEDIFETMNCKYLKATFDAANFVQCGVKVFPDAFNTLKDRIAVVHIKDALYKDQSVVPVGLGDGEIKKLLKELVNMNYDGFLTIEPHLGIFPGFELLENDIQFSEEKESDGIVNFNIAKNALYSMLKEIGVENYG